MSKQRLRDNAGRFQKYATAYITRQLQEVAEETGVNVRLVVADKLKEVYKDNVKQSYTPSSEEGKAIKAYNADKYNTHKKKVKYRHTGTFLRSIKTKIDGNDVKIVIDETVKYEDGTPATEVYEYLTKGTPDTQSIYAYTTKNGEVFGAKNYGMQPHLFEEHTMNQMKGFLASLQGDIKNQKYSTFRYTGKKRRRQSYKGIDIREG